ncbi:hypothetical protein LARV_00576 [Longilinea arvoryzae]|uniref:DUF5667 domain-containing protein n=2 Tax=Longilinea arvoryzae TaxID=360412 RepID=A0A0S7BDL1_9CHLR|nr:hypothetical protein LARV_00576 [Longilinea arvoryzae]
MKQPDVNLVLNEALSKLQAGEPMDQVLAECGEFSAELAPLLETARWLRQSDQRTVPRAAVARSRACFLRAADARAIRTSASFQRLHLALNLAVILAIVAGAVFFTGLRSASALPGQTLYPMKLALEQAQLAFASSDPAGKLLLEETFDQRRVDEAVRLVELGSGQPVNFAGFLSGGGDQPWVVGGIPLQLDAEQRGVAQKLAGSYIEVHGQVQSDGQVQVNALQLRFFDLRGVLADHEGERWAVSGIWVSITDQTQVDRPPAAGQKVRITAIRPSVDDFLALSMRLNDGRGGKLPDRTLPAPSSESERQEKTPGAKISPGPTRGDESGGNPEPGTNETRPSGEDPREKTRPPDSTATPDDPGQLFLTPMPSPMLEP